MIRLLIIENFKKNLTGSTTAFLDDFDVCDVAVARSTVVQCPIRKTSSSVSLIKILTYTIPDVKTIHKAVRKVQCNYNTTAIRDFFLYCSCIALVWTPAIQRCKTSFLQLAENLQATCSSCKKNLYCSCIALVLTSAIQQNFCVMLLQLYCSCIALVRSADCLRSYLLSPNFCWPSLWSYDSKALYKLDYYYYNYYYFFHTLGSIDPEG